MNVKNTQFYKPNFKETKSKDKIYKNLYKIYFQILLTYQKSGNQYWKLCSFKQHLTHFQIYLCNI